MSLNVYVTREIPKPGLDVLKENCQNVGINMEDRVLKKEELLEKVKDKDGVLCLLTDSIDKDIINAANNAKVFANYAVGYNNIDIKEATNKGIIVTNTPGVLTDATADHAWALLFASARRIVESDTYMRSGKWDGWGPMQFLGQDITGRTLGIIGAGRIGTNLALKSAGFKMKVLYTDAQQNPDIEQKLKAQKVGMEELLRKSDFISVHVPLIPETIHLIGEEEFALMKPSAVLVNTSRGPVVDEKALVSALKRRKIAAAGLDVYEEEPKAAPGLLDLHNVVVCPHIASATVETRAKMAVMAAENLVAALNGEMPKNIVNPEILSK